MPRLSLKKLGLYAVLGAVIFNVLMVVGAWLVSVDRSATSDLLTPADFNFLQYYPSSDVVTTVSANQHETSTIIRDDYDSAVFYWSEEQESIDLTVDIPAGSYYLAIDYFSLHDAIAPIEISVSVNNVTTSSWNNLLLRSDWHASDGTSLYDQYSNEVQPMTSRLGVWRTVELRDQMFFENHSLLFDFPAGSSTLVITKTRGSLLLGDIRIVQPYEIDSYEEYHSMYENQTIVDLPLITLEAEDYFSKSSPEIRLESVASPSASPYTSSRNELNVITESYFKESGQLLNYVFDAPYSGLYEITIKYWLVADNKISYASVLLDGKIPFAELQSYAFESSKQFVNHTLGANDTPYYFYLEAGVHALSVEITAEKTAHIYYQLQEMIDEIGDMQLEIMRLTSGNTDILREWSITKFIPDAITRLEAWQTETANLLEDAINITTVNKNENNDLTRRLVSAVNKFKTILEDPDKLPSRLSIFSEGSNSIVADFSTSLVAAQNQGFTIDQLFVHGSEVQLPNAKAGFFAEYIATLQKIGQSTTELNLGVEEEKVVDVWVYRSRYIMNVMQQYVDRNYTAEDGTKIRLSILPNEGKIILANAAGTQPDAVVGVSGWNPFDLALRGALAPLDEMEGFADVVSDYAPGSLLHQMYDGHIYGIPETQDFFVTFYRKDILEDLNLEVPETYQDIIEILPTLQAYGMNYYLPLSANSALKAINATAPFIYQNNGDLFTEDAFGTGIDTPEALAGIELMTDLYTTYGLPLQVPNFYDEFRSGTLPIGVGSFNDYLKFAFASPELVNKWGIALAPGVEQQDHTIKRAYAGTAQSVAIFEKSEKKEQSWDFLSWWLSEETQEGFMFSLQNTYGDEYIWNTANLAAVDALPISEEHQQVIFEQWNYLYEVPKIPGGFAIERGISDIWNKVVLEGANLRTAVDTMVITVNREIRRKYAEFGFLDDDGNVLKPYRLATIEEVMRLLEGEGD